MLVLSRKVGEEIVIGDRIRVKVLSVRGNQIRLGFTAPQDVQIQREELIRALRQSAEPAPSPSRGEQVKPDVIIVREPGASVS